MDTLWQDLLIFVKDKPTIYVIFIIIVIVFSERKIGGITVVSPLVPQVMFNVTAA
jgi:hypothetical protein